MAHGNDLLFHCQYPLPPRYDSRTVRCLQGRGLSGWRLFLPDDFHVLWQQGKAIGREGDKGGKVHLLPRDNPELMTLAQAQLTELLTQYGPIDVIFFDGDPTGLREVAWELQPTAS